MKKIKNGIVKLFKSPLFAVVCLVVGVAAFLGYRSYNKQIAFGYGSVSQAELHTIINTAQDSNGNIYLIDSDDQGSSTHLYRFDAEKKAADLVIDYTEMPFDCSFIDDFCVDDEGNIYILSAGASDMDSSDWTSCILKYNSKGKLVREVVRYNDDTSIYALNYYDGRLEYLLYDCYSTVQLISVDAETSEQIVKGSYESDYSNFITGASADGEGGYLINSINNELIRLDETGEAESIFIGDYDIYDKTNTVRLTGKPCFINGTVYTPGGFEGNIIYEINDGNAEVYIDTLEEIYGTENEVEQYLDYENYSGCRDFEGKLAYYSDSCLYVDAGEEITEITEFDLPFANQAKAFFMAALPVVSCLLILAGAVSSIGCLMRWRFTILSKMLWIMIPVIVAMIGVFTRLMTKSIENTYIENTTNQLLAVSDLSKDKFDGDAIAEMSSFEILNDGRYYELLDTLDSAVAAKSSEWSRNMKPMIYICVTEDYWISPDSDASEPFLDDFNYAASDLSEVQRFDGTGTWVKPVYDGASTVPYELSAFTPITDSDGNTAAYLVISASLDTMQKEISELQREGIITGIICMILLIAAEAVTSIYIVNNLRKAKTVISGIADGDFSSRVSKPTKDELGEICHGVNNMASQLETLFTEKDKNEKFYYKFVPEKFRELLHKESFTDLALGDAESQELTVLFCDIRAFSLNSEMMTAKENFEFVNVIYGKAGPVIRRNGGFVDKYIGDAVMALFESADAAIKAGIELYEEIVLDHSTAEQLGMASINIGIGIHTGMARIGIVGEEERMSGTVISNTVNIASRLESLTKQYQTAMIITKDTLDRLTDPDSLSTRYLGMVQVAGVNEVKALYEVLDALEDERRIPRSENSRNFREGVKEFHLGNYERSLEIFEQLSDNSTGNDPALKKYADYLREHISKGEKTHNVFRFDKK